MVSEKILKKRNEYKEKIGTYPKVMYVNEYFKHVLNFDYCLIDKGKIFGMEVRVMNGLKDQDIRMEYA